MTTKNKYLTKLKNKNKLSVYNQSNIFNKSVANTNDENDDTSQKFIISQN